MGTLDGQCERQQRNRIRTLGPTEDVDVCHLGVLGRRRSEWKIEHRPEVVLELVTAPSIVQ